MSENEQKELASVRVEKEDHEQFVILDKKNGMTIQGFFKKVVNDLRKKELLKEIS